MQYKVNEEIVVGSCVMQAIGPVNKEGFEVYVIIKYTDQGCYEQVAMANSEYLAEKLLRKYVEKEVANRKEDK